jgi:hypothetical protein
MEALKQMSKRVDDKGNRNSAGSDDSLLKWNDLVYTKMTNLSVISQKNLQRFNSQSLNYDNTSSSIDFIYQSGDNLVGPGSCIQFDLTVTATGATNFSFGTGSSVNIIRDAILMSRQGDEVDRCNNLNVYETTKSLFREKTWFDTTGSLMGYESGSFPLGTKHFFQIPLENILPVFATGRMIPSQLMSGSRLQLNLEKSIKRLFSFDTEATDISWKIDNARMVLSLSRPNDKTQSLLDRNSAKNSLEFQFASVYTQKTKATDSISEQISKSVGRALKLYVVPLEDPANNTNIITAPQDVGYTDAQLRAGSLYLPQYRLSTDEIYHYTLQACNKLGKSVRYNKTNSQLIGDVWGTDLESHHLIRYSGQSLNNSRVLYVESAFTNTEPKEVFLFLEYAREVRIYLNSVAVDS